jgi:hypothetical protein
VDGKLLLFERSDMCTWNVHTKETFYSPSPNLRRCTAGFIIHRVKTLLKLLTMARPDDTNQETILLLQQIASACATCQKLGPRPIRFKVSLPNMEDIVFGDEISIGLMFIDGQAVLHVVDTATRFSAATFLESHSGSFRQSVEGVWLALIETRFTLYTGYPNRSRIDAGSIFASPRWKELSNMAGITLRMSGVEAHNSLGIGKRMHGPLRRIYNKIRMDYPHIPAGTLLKIGVNAMNDAIGENGLVSLLLVFGVIPRYPALNTELPNQKVRIKVIAATQMEMNSISAERRITTALAKNIPSAAEHVYAVGGEVLAFREKESSWIGPFKVVANADWILTMQQSTDAKVQE